VVATGSPAPQHGVRRRGRPLRRVVGVASLSLGLIAVLSACTVEDAFYFGWPRGGVTPQSQRVFDLWIGSAVAAMAVGVFVWGLIFWCVVAYRKRGEELPAQTRFNLPIELIYSVAPFLIVSVLFYYTAIVQTDVNQVRPNPDVTVQVTAFKWNWKFSYPNEEKMADGLPVSTVGTSSYVPVLVVPTGQRIRFVEHSEDVIHSFWVPDMLFKRDVFPGNVVNQFETTILTEGAYVGRCAELCGAYHYGMNFELRAVSPEQFDAFLDAKRQGLSTPDALAAIGEEPYATSTSSIPTDRRDPVTS
jgi:cytochrome c oxidase subunit 2